MMMFWAGFVLGFCIAIGVASYINTVEAKKRALREKRSYNYYRGRRKL